MQIKKHQMLIISSVLMMMLMGTVYTYSIFRVQIESIYQVGTLQSGLPYMTSLLFYALSMMISGRLMRPTRLRKFVFIGTLLIAFGWFLSGLVTSFILLIITYGILIGIGVGMVYGVPIYMAQKLFPEKSGLMTGIILLGFGMSPLLTAPLASVLIDAIGLKSSFMVFGVVFLLIQLPLSYLFVLEKPIGVTHTANETEGLKKLFLWIYLLFVIATTIGLMMIGLSYQVGVTYYSFNRLEVTASLSLFAIMNGVARPIFGRLMDKKGFNYSVILSLILLTVASLLGLINQGNSILLYVISFALYWFNLGAWLAIIPSAVKSFYGIDHYPKIYGLIFTAYGVGAVIGTITSGIIMDFLKWTSYLYVMIMVLVTVSFVIVYVINRQHQLKS